MLSLMKTLSAAASGMEVQSERLRLTAENVANVDTPGYRRKLVTFKQIYDDDIDVEKVTIDQVSLDQKELNEFYDPTHPMADEAGNVALSNVDLLTEITDSREAQRSYEANVNIFDQARRMYDSVLELLQR